MGCGAAEATGLGFFFVLLLLAEQSWFWASFFFLFHTFSLLIPPRLPKTISWRPAIIWLLSRAKWLGGGGVIYMHIVVKWWGQGSADFTEQIRLKLGSDQIKNNVIIFGSAAPLMVGFCYLLNSSYVPPWLTFPARPSLVGEARARSKRESHWGWYFDQYWASLRFEKTWENIDSCRGFTETVFLRTIANQESFSILYYTYIYIYYYISSCM